MTKPWSHSIRINYDGSQVRSGTRRNVRDLGSLKQAVGGNIAVNRASAASIQSHSNASQAGAREFHKLAASIHTTAKEVSGNTTAFGRQTTEVSRNTRVLRHNAGAQLKVQSETRKTATGSDRAAAATHRHTQAAKKAASQNRILSTTYSRLAVAISAALGGYASAGFVTAVSSSELLTARLQGLTTSAEHYNEVQQFLVKSSDDLNIRYNILADSYSRLLVLEKQRTVTAIESRQILKGLTNTSKQMGASNEQVERSMYGMVQALTQGTVQTTELLQTTESMPGLLQAMDKAAGMAAGGFKRLVGEGKVTSQMFKETLIRAFDEFSGGAQNMAGTISASTNDFLSVYDNLLVKLQQPVNAAVVPVIHTATDALKVLGENTDVLGDVAFAAGVAATILAGKLAGSLATSSSAFIKSGAAAWQKNRADLAAAKSALEVARAEQIASAQMFKTTVSIKSKAAAAKMAAASVANLRVATDQYNAAAARMNLRSRAAAASMAFLGGPAGIVTIAAAALAYFALNSDEAANSGNDLKLSVDELTSGFEKLTATQMRARDLRIADKVDELNLQISETSTELEDLQAKLNRPLRLRGDPSGSKAAEKRQAINKEIVFQEERIERLEASKNALLKSQLDLKERIADPDKFAPDETQQAANDPFAGIDFSKGLKQLDKNLMDRRDRVIAGAKAQKDIVAGALAAEQITAIGAATRIEKIERRKQAQLADIARDEQQKRDDAANTARQKELDDIERHHEEQIRQLLGFNSRKEQIEAGLRERLREARRNQEVLEAQGFSNQAEANEHAHQERLLDIKFRGNAQVRDMVVSRAEWERKTELEKTQHVIGIGEAGFKALAGQSKKAAAAYKAFSIGKALINTYEMATGAYNAMVSIPYVGPGLAIAAAAAATAFGFAQVNAIKNQPVGAAYHGGRDYIPSEQTALLQRGERVVSPRQNVALTSAVERINKGRIAAQGSVTVTYSPQFTVTGTDNTSMDKLRALESQMQQRFMNELLTVLQGRYGPIYQAVRKA